MFDDGRVIRGEFAVDREFPFPETPILTYQQFLAEFVRVFEQSGPEIAQPLRKASLLLTKLDALRRGDADLAAHASAALGFPA